jgi:hypothetical protein
LLLELGCKLKPTIGNDIFRKTMISKNMIKEYIHCSFASNYFGTRNEMSHLCETIHHHQDKVIKTRRWKVYDEIHGN